MTKIGRMVGSVLTLLGVALGCSAPDASRPELAGTQSSALSGTTLINFASASTSNDTDAADKSGGLSQLNANHSSCTLGAYADCWDYYIEFFDTYSGTFTYNLASISAANVLPQNVVDLHVSTKFQGPTGSSDYWQWQIYRVSDGQWVTLGASLGYPDWVWNSVSLGLPAGSPASQFVASNRDIQLRLRQGVPSGEPMELDSLQLEVGWDTGAGSGSGSTLIVAPTGGQYTQIQAALAVAVAGDTVLVKAGTYHENLSFPRSGSSAQGFITLQGEPGAILDGTGVAEVGIHIASRNYVKVAGLRIQNYAGSDVPAGIFVEGSSSNVELRNNLVEFIETDDRENGNAHGIAVYGDSSTAMTNIVIDGNEIRNCFLGSSESMVLNGNVTNFVVSNNVIHHNDNIGIDLIGFEETGPLGADQARNGVCVGNLIYDITSEDNPAYGGDLAANGIYVDGGRDIVIERNTVRDCDIGIEIGNEHPDTTTSNITVRNNFVSGSEFGNIVMGGYLEELGSVTNVKIFNNTLHEAADGEIILQFNSDTVAIKNNLCWGVLDLECLHDEGGNNVGVSVNNNLYRRLTSGTQSPGDFADANAIYVDNAGFVSASDFHLAAGSPAVNAGVALGNDAGGQPLAGTTDIDGQVRVNGTIDIGADER